MEKKLLKFNAEGREFAKFLRSLEQFIQTVRGHRDHSSITSSKRWVGAWVGGVRKWQFLMIYNTANHQRVGWVGLKKSKT